MSVWQVGGVVACAYWIIHIPVIQGKEAAIKVRSLGWEGDGVVKRRRSIRGTSNVNPRRSGTCAVSLSLVTEVRVTVSCSNI